MRHHAHPHPYEKRYTLKDAAEACQLIVVRCNLCRRTVHYLASDLVEVFGGEVEARRPPISCSKCKSDDYIRCKPRLPEIGDYGSLVVRRPVGVKMTRIWKDVKLGD